MKTTFKGKKDVRACGTCNWCPQGAPRCAWRLGLYLKEMSPQSMGVVLHHTKIGGHNSFVAQPYDALVGIPAGVAPLLSKIAEHNTVVVTTSPVHLGGCIEAVLAPTIEIGEAVCDALDFGKPKEPVVEGVEATELSLAGDAEDE